jgi:hypothetical protein
LRGAFTRQQSDGDVELIGAQEQGLGEPLRVSQTDVVALGLTLTGSVKASDARGVLSSSMGSRFTTWT